ncbi:MAG TPA: RidA family protein [Chryseolinea sp.]
MGDKKRTAISLFNFVITAMLISACAPTNLRSIERSPTSYAQAVSISNFRSLVFVSGQIPVSDKDEKPPTDFQEQCRTVWENITKQLAACDMKLTDIVKVTTYLADRSYREQNYKIRHEVLGNHCPALTVIVVDIYDEEWLVEIEVIAAR